MTSTIPEIYILWHPRCVVGEKLARRIHAWLRPGNGLGPQVFYRSLPGPSAPKDGLPAPLPGELRPGIALSVSSHAANVQICLLLLDEHMIADAGWRHWIAQLGSPAPHARRVVLPVALDATAFNVPPPLGELNFLRPAGLPLPVQATFPDVAFETVVRSLLKQLTETLCRLLLITPNDNAPLPPSVGLDGAQPKIALFLSHAKVDGTAPAKRIRDYIYSQTQLAAFYDENDIRFGSAFGRVIRSNMQSAHTAAMIAVRSTRYASRPWCRRELSLFRRPLQDGQALQGGERWRLNPLLIVDVLDGSAETRNIPEIGNAPVVRWRDDSPEQEEHVVTTVMRNVMLGTFHAALGRTLPATPDTIVINWVPDPTSLLCIPRVRATEQDLRIFYPGQGLSGLELDILDEFFPRLAFHSFESLMS